MPTDLYAREDSVLAKAKAASETPDVSPELAELTGEYARLLKVLRRIVRVNDRNEASLRDANTKIETQNAEIQQTLDDLRQTQDDLIEAEKMASLGGLVAGVAHEVNTPLGIILTAATSLTDETKRLRVLADGGQARKSDVSTYFHLADEMVGLIQTHADKAAHLITSFKEVAVDQTSETRRTLDLKAYVQEVVDSLRPELKRTPYKITVEGVDGLSANTYPGAIGQIVTNLVFNSVKHGFEEAAQGAITLNVEAKSSEWVRLTCRDDGKGMAPDVRDKVFEPFFTTKRGRGGSGLGLHIIQNLVTGRLKGKITVASEPDDGTCFTIDFPVNPERDEKNE